MRDVKIYFVVISYVKKFTACTTLCSQNIRQRCISHLSCSVTFPSKLNKLWIGDRNSFLEWITVNVEDILKDALKHFPFQSWNSTRIDISPTSMLSQMARSR